MEERLDATLQAAPSIALAGRNWELDAACAEAAQANWDGYGAAPVTRQTYFVARRFLDALPLTAPTPEIAIDPDGEVSFRWYRDARAVLAVSASSAGLLSYAVRLGDNEEYGTKRFTGEIPEEFTTVLAELFA